LLSEIASIPIEDNGVPLVNSIFAVLLLVSLEIINSAVCLKSAKIRSMVEGNPMIVIRHGKVDQKKLKQLRFSSEDLIEQLRQKDVFDINDVKFAVIETNGQLSVMLKDDKQPITPETLDSEQKSKSLQCMVINDGRIISKSFRDCNMDEKKLKNILKNNKVKQEEILFMLADDMGNYSIVRKEIET
ncbi:MAG: DUF421 domain-containing protein, partial [Acutalibacteraceae bacterium]|nr:DUF421 domain-containing protein [Acutalibacteraceae bacterium]